VPLVGQLEQVELPGNRAVLVGEEREVGADPGPERAVDVGLVDGHRGNAPVLALDLVLQGDEPAHPDLLLRAPPAAHERQHERPRVGDLAQRQLAAGRLREPDVRERVADIEVRPHECVCALGAARRYILVTGTGPVTGPSRGPAYDGDAPGLAGGEQLVGVDLVGPAEEVLLGVRRRGAEDGEPLGHGRPLEMIAPLEGGLSLFADRAFEISARHAYERSRADASSQGQSL
jgi:hypothetical protein